MRNDATGDGRDGYPPISDYAIIGNCRTAALVSRAGAVEWMCLPRFDSPSVFAAILDRARGGRFVVAPRGQARSTRRYIDATNVLETTFTTDGGALRVTDFLAAATEPTRRAGLRPHHELIRIAECIRGEVEVNVECEPRPGYGAQRVVVADRGPLGCTLGAGARSMILRSDMTLTPASGGAAVVAQERLRAGERRTVSLSFDIVSPSVLPAVGDAARRRLEETIGYWRGWAGAFGYDGPRRDSVLRSALTLKLMTFAPSGGVVAAPTTSLPERIGGPRNWDYRYCWLRDASMTLRALFDLGFADEGEAFISWLLNATRLTAPRLQVLYDVYGETRLTERELPALEGYRGSAPVRVGNGAKDQLQLDTYGAVADAAHEFVRRDGVIDRMERASLLGMGETVCRLWREPDNGIWEKRSGRQHHTHSKAMCWVTLDRLIGMHDSGALRAPVDRFRTEREAIREAIEQRGFNRRLGSYVSAFDGDDLDASLLNLANYAYCDPRSERMTGTRRAVYARLGPGPLLRRYLSDDGLEGGEGAFGLCSFWGVECLAREGLMEQATEAFDTLCGYANDVGLYSEEIDPATGAALGNFPQAFTHVGHISAALTLHAARRGEDRGPGRPPGAV